MPAPRDPFEITDLSDFVDSLMKEGKGWARAEQDYLILLLSRRTAGVSRVMSGAFMGLLLLATIALFSGVAAAIAIVQAGGDAAWGYLIVAGFFAVVLLVFALLWKGSLGARFELKIINLFHGH